MPITPALVGPAARPPALPPPSPLRLVLGVLYRGLDHAARIFGWALLLGLPITYAALRAGFHFDDYSPMRSLGIAGLSLGVGLCITVPVAAVRLAFALAGPLADAARWLHARWLTHTPEEHRA